MDHTESLTKDSTSTIVDVAESPLASLEATSGEKVDADLDVGARIRELRKQRGWTLVEASSKFGIARSTVSKIECGQMSPTIGVLQKIAQGLGIDLSSFFGNDRRISAKGRRSITRVGTGPLLEHHNRVHEVLCSELSNKQMMPFRARISAQSSHVHQRWYRHEGEEFVYVLEGTVTLRSEIYEPAELHEGDCVYLDGTMAHVFVNFSDRPAVVLWVMAN